MSNSQEYREYKIVSTKAGLTYHLMKLNSDAHDLQSIGSTVKFYREIPEVNQTESEKGMSGEAADGAKPVIAGKLKGQNGAFKPKSRTFFIGRQEGGQAVDTHKKRAPDPDARPLMLSNKDKSLIFEGKVEGGAQNSNYVLLMFYVSVFE